MNKEETQNSGFTSLGIAPALLEVLTRLKYITPTPIQAQAIPVAITGKDVVGIAQTGTGKTLAFGIPMIQRLSQITGKGLIVLPTRELADQVQETIKKIGNNHVRTALLIGGASMYGQKMEIKRDPHIVIATPGRLIDHLEQGNIRLNKVEILVLDEADRMFDMGFAPQLRKIFSVIPPADQRQTMLFSATMPPEIMKIAAGHMKLPVRVEVAPAGTTADRVTQEIFMVRKDEKNRLVEKLLTQYPVTTLIFTRTKFGAKRLAKTIRDMGATSAEIHSDRSLGQRREALDGFKTGKYRVLVATDIAARGIDVNGIGLVLNYDLPMNTADYVHRIGRTARAGAGGHAISFVAPEQRGEIREIERLIKKTLTLSKLPTDLPPARAQEKPQYFEETARPYGRGRRPGGFGSRPGFGSSRSSRPGFGARPSRPGFGSSRPGFGHRPSGPRPAGTSDGRPSFPRRRFRRG